MHLELQLLREIPSEPVLRAAWNALVEQMDRPEVFYTWEWARAVDDAYAPALRPWLVLAREAGELVGMVALALDSQNRAVFLTSTTADYCDFLSHPSRRGELVERVLAELRRDGISELVLANLPADSPTVPALETAAAKHGFHVFARTAYECARINLGSPEQREQLKLTISNKKNFRQNMNKLAREGPVQISHLTRWEQVEPALPAFANAHVARFLSTNRISNLVRSDRRRFLSELARLLCESKTLTLTRLMVGDRPVAWNYGFRFRGSWFWYQPTFESRLEQCSPGRCLLTSMIIEASDTPALEVIDLGLGAEGYKESFANGSRPTLHVTISRSPLRTMREKVRYRVAERIKRSPKLEASIRGGLSRVSSAQKRLKKDGPGRFATWITTRAASSVATREEVRFYQWKDRNHTEAATSGNLALEALDLGTLAKAAMAYEGDAETAAYLLRSAQRLNAGSDAGFALVDRTGTPLHFCWVSPFQGFVIDELQTRLSAPVPDAAMIFDCWTPAAARNQGYYASAIAKLAHQLTLAGRTPWIFSAATNRSSVRGIEKVGFCLRYSMISRKTPAGRTITTEVAPANSPREAPVHF